MLGLAPGENVRVIVLCPTVSRNERRLAEARGVAAVVYPSDDDEELAAAIMSSRETLAEGVSP
jgi:hypothetical protein